MKLKEITGALLLLLTALIWGSAFIAQKTGLQYVGPCTFNGVRSILGAFALVPCIALIDRFKGRKPSLFGESDGDGRRTLLAGGLYCGIILGCASMLQQLGIKHTTIGKAGFITTLYIIIVPIIGLLFHRRMGLVKWLCVLITMFGMYLLCFKGGGKLNYGDVIVFFSSFIFAVHIIVIDHYSKLTDCVRMSCIQFFVSGILSLSCALIFEKIVWNDILNAYIPICYAGILSCAVAYTLQIVGQRDVHPVIASLIMSLESVFAALGGWLVLHERLSTSELCGCIILFAAVITAQLPERQ